MRLPAPLTMLALGALAFVAPSPLTGCAACPDCDAVLTVRLENVPAGAFSVDVALPDGPEGCEVSAEGAVDCSGGIAMSLDEGTAALEIVTGGGLIGSFDLVVSAGEAVILEETGIAPAWSEPSSRACEADCRSAEVTRDLNG